MRFLFLLIVSVLLPVVSSNAQKILLSFDPPEGMVMQTEFFSKSVIDQEVMGIQQSIEMNMDMILEGEVLEKDADNTQIRYTYTRMSVSSNSAMFSLSLNSEGDQADPGNQLLKSLTGKGFVTVMDRSGRVTEISGVDKIIEEIIADYPNTGMEAQAYRQTLKETFGSESFSQNIEQLAAYYPDYKLGVGDTWVYENSVSMPQIEMKLINNATVKSITAENVIIQINTLLKSPEDNRLEVQGMTGSMKLEGSQLSEIKVDPKTGIVKEGVVTQEINGEIRMEMNEGSSDPLVIPMLIKSKIEMITRFPAL